ncbi:hypothetical protein Tco_1423268, partial [Tanacetum coccineum]
MMPLLQKLVSIMQMHLLTRSLIKVSIHTSNVAIVMFLVIQWIVVGFYMHPELKPKFTKDKKGFVDKRRVTNPKAHMATHTTYSFSSSPVALLNEFANYLPKKTCQGAVQDEDNYPSFVSVANGKGSRVLGKGKINLISKSVESDVLYFLSFPFQLLSVKKLTSSLNCQALFTPTKAILKQRRGIHATMLSMGNFTSPPSHNVTQEHEHSSQDFIEQPPNNATQEHENSLQDSTATESSTNNSFSTTNDLQIEVPRRNPPRDRQPPAKMNDYVSYTTKYPISYFLTYKKLSPSHTAFLTTLSNVHYPKTFQEAQSRKAMQEELAALVENKTWSIVSLPKGKHAVG